MTDELNRSQSLAPAPPPVQHKKSRQRLSVPPVHRGGGGRKGRGGKRKTVTTFLLPSTDFDDALDAVSESQKQDMLDRVRLPPAGRHRRSGRFAEELEPGCSRPARSSSGKEKSGLPAGNMAIDDFFIAGGLGVGREEIRDPFIAYREQKGLHPNAELRRWDNKWPQHNVELVSYLLTSSPVIVYLQKN